MFLTSIEIDGFKSYAKRQVISGFDKQFNAITGLNGSGKSNILDSICFVLGITNLNCIRATSISDLVYKQGQAGVTRATVTLTFDNTDKSFSLSGYMSEDYIIIRRYVTSSGKSDYSINGTRKTASDISDFFRSIGLNVNNPHFLIMQGRITKVLNMKPKEILGMLEEAAGTKVYDVKRDNAMAQIKKKEVGILELDSIIEKNLLPTVEKLKKEREKYHRYQKIDRELTAHERRLNAFYYWSAKESQAQLETQKEQLALELQDAHERKIEMQQQIKDMEQENAAKENEKKKREQEVKVSMDSNVEKIRAEQDRMESALNAAKNNVRAKEHDIADLESRISEDEKEISNRRKQLEKLVKDYGDLEQASALAEAELEEARKKHKEHSEDRFEKEDGTITTTNQLCEEAKTEVSTLAVELKDLQKQEKRSIATLAENKERYERCKNEVSDDRDALNRLSVAKDRETQELSQIDFNPTEYNELQRSVNNLDYEVRNAANERRDRNVACLYFNFDNTRVPNIRPEQIYGRIFMLISVKDQRFDVPLFSLIRGSGFQVVVDAANTATALITSNATQTRVTYLPLDSLRAPDNRQKVAAAKQIAAERGAECYSALELIEYDERIAVAVQYLFGSALVCSNSDVASELCYNDRVRMHVVTMAGDVFEPSGTASGGSDFSKERNWISIARAELPREQHRKDLERRFRDAKARLEVLHQTKPAFDNHQAALDRIEQDINEVKRRMGQSDAGKLATLIPEIEKELREIKTRYSEIDVQLRAAENKVRQYEEMKMNKKKFIEEWRKKMEAAQAKLNKLNSDSKEQVRQREIHAEIKNYEASIQNQREQIKPLRAELEQLNTEKAAKEDAFNKAKEKTDAAMESLKSFTTELRSLAAEIKKIEKSIDEKKKCIMNADIANEATEKKIEETEARIKALKDQQKKSLHDHRWIADIVEQLNKKDGSFDFTGMTRTSGEAKLNELKEEKAKLERTVNITSMAMLQSAEEDTMQHQKKREVLIADKKTILDTIADFDKRKKMAIEQAYKIVTAEFGSIFSTLLPNANAKLEPPAGKTPLDGLEVKVAFSNLWKEGLTELSGGQRSLVALSLILAMLKFKPAPLYILDEVDAALDLSHTQNVGKMIRKHFKQSQFIIVSLKEGMFSNANVLFKTRFDDQTSIVTRHVKSQCADNDDDDDTGKVPTRRALTDVEMT